MRESLTGQGTGDSGGGHVRRDGFYAAGTRELLLVLDGQVELRAGQHAEVLAAGDSASFGARPQRTRNSLEALLRRAQTNPRSRRRR